MTLFDNGAKPIVTATKARRSRTDDSILGIVLVGYDVRWNEERFIGEH